MKRWLVVRGYFKKLYPVLRKKFGDKLNYSFEQIIFAMEESKVSLEHLPYALALYQTDQQLLATKMQQGLDFVPSEVRGYIAKRFYEGHFQYQFNLPYPFKISPVLFEKG